MRERFCLYCHLKPISAKNRKYCREHSAQASVLWKKDQREQWAANGDKYWLDGWKNRTPEARREYFRNYMRKYRRRERTAQSKPTAVQLRKAA